MQALPLGGGVAAIEWTIPVETQIAPGDEVSLVVSDVALCIRLDGVVRRIGMQTHILVKLIMSRGLGA